MEENNNLTDKQRRFCEEYLLDLCAACAAIRAGYSEKTAMEQGYQLLQKTSVLSYIEKLQKERSERTKVKADQIIEELYKLGFSDITRYCNSDWTVKDMDKLPKEVTAAIQSIKTTVDESLSLDGKSINRRTKVEFKLHPKLPPLQLLGQHIGMFNDKVPASALPPVTDQDETERT